MIEKEVAAAQSDLRDARESLEAAKHKRALVAIRELYSKELSPSLTDRFEDAMNLSHEADYGLKFSAAGAITVIEGAEELLSATKTILGIKLMLRDKAHSPVLRLCFSLISA